MEKLKKEFPNSNDAIIIIVILNQKHPQTPRNRRDYAFHHRGKSSIQQGASKIGVEGCRERRQQELALALTGGAWDLFCKGIQLFVGLSWFAVGRFGEVGG